MKYALVAPDGTVHNVVLWDGVPYTPPVIDEETWLVTEPAKGWDPPEGLAAVPLADDHPAGPGDRLDPDTLDMIPRDPPPEAEPTLEERLAALEARLGPDA